MAVNMANLFVSKGHSSILIVTRITGKLVGFLNPDVKIFYLDKSGSFDLTSLQKLFHIIKNIQPDIIHAHATSIYWACLVNFFLKYKVPIIWHDHYGESEFLEKRSVLLLKLLSPKIAGVVVVNNDLKSWSINSLGIPSDNTVYLRNFPMLDTQSAVKNSVFTIIQVANFRPQKDHFTALEAFDLMKKEGRVFQVYWAGILNDERYVSDIKVKIKSLKLDNVISLLGEIEDVVPYLNQSHLGLLTSRSEGLPIALLEYGLAKLPVVCTAVGQCNEVISDPSLGFIVEPGQARRVAEALGQVMDNRELGVQLGKNLFNKINVVYGPDKFYRDYMDFISNFVPKLANSK